MTLGISISALMLQGTGSDVGKSLLVAGLCRAYTRRGLAVRPFKPQNMSNNAAVTADGGEIGRAQALQARACGVPLSVHMNPVLLKPQTEIGAQVVVHGKVCRNATARDYQLLKADLLPAVLESFRHLQSEADLVLVEGAGSPAEINLREGDIANMGFAEAAELPVVLIGDIERGGVIASIVGTWGLLSDSERHLLKGYVVNKFRGDVSLFDGGLAAIEERTGLESFGVIPYFAEAIRLPPEDAMNVDRQGADGHAAIRIAVPIFSRIANFDDLDPLLAEPDVSVSMVRPGQPLPGDADLIVLPGTKATLADLALLREQGWDIDIAAHVRRGGSVIGICGGYQMLGKSVSDPLGIEGPPGTAAGLGLLDLQTKLCHDKTLVEIAGADARGGDAIRGYEMHVGITTGPDLRRPMLTIDGRPEGAVSADGRISGCYVHGLFAEDGYRHAVLNRLRDRAVSGLSYEAEIDAVLDRLADHLEAHMPLDRLLEVAVRPGSSPPSAARLSD